MRQEGRDQREVDHHDLLHQQAVSSPHPSFSPPYSPPPLLGCLKGLQALTPLLKEPVRQALGCLLSGLASSYIPPTLNLLLLLFPILASAENTAKRHNQNNGMTARLPKSQNNQRLQKLPGVKIMTGSKMFTFSKIMTGSKIYTGSNKFTGLLGITRF